MTITYKGNSLFANRRLIEKSTSGTLNSAMEGNQGRREPKTTIDMQPNNSYPLADVVVLTEESGRIKKLVGPDISDNAECRVRGIGWYNQQELTPRHSNRYYTR